MTPLIRTTLSVLVLSALAGPALAQPVGPPWANKFFLPDIDKNPTQPAPTVVVHDFGAVPKGTLCAKKFTLTNIYDVPMQVIDIRRSCGCLYAYPPERVLQPNETDEFTITMDTAQFTGPNAQTIDVTFRGVKDGAEHRGTAKLYIRGNSRPDVTISPGAVLFGAVAQGAKPTQALTLEYTGSKRDGWKVTGVVPPTGPIDVEVRDAGRGPAGAKYYVNVTLKPDAPAGALAEVVTLKTNDPAAPLVQVTVTGLVQAPLVLSTDRLEFPKTKVGEETVLKVLVRSSNSHKFLIRPVADDGSGFSVETFPGPSPVHNVTVKFRPAKPGVVRREIALTTDLDGGATGRLLVAGEGEPE